MKNPNGFTIVELMIVIVIMGILTGLGMVSMRNNLIDGRNDERRTDVQNIVTYLDGIYQSGQASTPGEYPAVEDIDTPGEMKSVFSGLDANSLRAPDTPEGTISLVLASNGVQTTAGVLPKPDITTYVYQPMAVTNAGTWFHCYVAGANCRKFNLYYMLEGDGTIYKVSGKYQ